MREPLSFWQVTFAVVLGVTIATALQWLFAATMAGVLLSQFQMPEASRPTPPKSSTGPAPLPDPRPPYFQPARVLVPEGEIACMRGWQVRRERNGWTEVMTPAGTRGACRDYR